MKALGVICRANLCIKYHPKPKRLQRPVKCLIEERITFTKENEAPYDLPHLLSADRSGLSSVDEHPQRRSIL